MKSVQGYINELAKEAEERNAARVGMVKTEDFHSSETGSLPVGSTKEDNMNWFRNINCFTTDIAGVKTSRLSLFQ